MLNELMLVKNGLASIDPDSLKPRHKDISEPGKANLLRVILDNTNGGCITELECLSNDKNKLYWTQGNGNKNQFPAVKLPFPLRPAGVEIYRVWKKEKRPKKDWLDDMQKIRNVCSVNLSKQSKWPSYRDKLKERAKIYRKLEGDADIISKLIDTFLGIEFEPLLTQLDEKLWEQCQRNLDSNISKLAALIWFGVIEKNEGEENNIDFTKALAMACKNKSNDLVEGEKIPDGKRPTLLFDIFAHDRPSSASNKRYRDKISSLLFEHEETSGTAGTCAITGEDKNLVPDTFPSVKCEHLGKVTIFSRKKETPTFQRYGQKGAGSMPVSTALADEMASALRYLSDSNKKGINWDILPGETGSSGDLLLAFCRALTDTKLMPLVTQNADPLNEEDYEEETKQICQMFKGKDTILDNQVDFFILRKISDGVQKVIFSSSHKLQSLQSSAENWVNDCKNVPKIELAFFRKGEKTPCFISPKPFSPKQIAWLFGYHYNRSLRKSSVTGLPFAEMMRLFLHKQHETSSITRLLKRLFKQYANLLVQVALKKTAPAKHHRDALHVIVTIGLLLSKINRKKEVYMQEFAYKLGQFCAALDEIHIGYCVSERKGQIPNRLIGNQAYAAAISSPLKALEITAQRSAVYQAWAKKISQKPDISDAKIKNAKFAYLWLRKHCHDLHQVQSIQNLSVFSATDKAELLLGYLAGRPIEKSKQSNGENES